MVVRNRAVFKIIDGIFLDTHQTTVRKQSISDSIAHQPYMCNSDEMCYREAMQNQALRSKPKKRGRKPVGDRPMSGAERMRRVRQRLRDAGYREYGVRIG